MGHHLRTFIKQEHVIDKLRHFICLNPRIHRAVRQRVCNLRWSMAVGNLEPACCISQFSSLI